MSRDMKQTLSTILAALALVLAALPVRADVRTAFDTPGTFALMRHALAPGTSDPPGFRLDDCATQRNLDARGRAQARAIGKAFRASGIAFDSVYSSQWCRCLETARLLDLGPVTEEPAFNSFFQDRSRKDSQTRAALDLMRAQDGRAMIVTHQVNITALTGIVPRSGEVLIVRMAEDGLEVVDRFRID